MLRVFEAFSGIGTQRMALRNLGIEHEVVCIAEIDKFAIRSYEAIHGETLNLGDVSKINPNDVPDHDLFTYSFPCQDISVAGKGKGFKPESGTRSSLLWECEKIIEAKKPKYLLMENVKALIFKKFKPGFKKWLRLLEELGYTNYWQVLNAKDYGIPQNRERVFCVSILGTHEPYVFPKPIPLDKRLKDVLEDEVDERFYISQEKTEKLISQIKDKDISNTVRASGRGSVDRHQWDMVCVGNVNPSGKGVNGNVWGQNGLSPTLTTNKGEELEPKIVASRGRNPNNPSDRTTGSPTEQRLEVNKQGISNTLTSVQKDNLVLEPAILTPKRTEYGKSIRKDYESGKIQESRHNMTELQPREDGISNTLTTVQKDNLVLEPSIQQVGNIVSTGNWKNPQRGRVYSTEGISPSLNTVGGGGLEPKILEDFYANRDPRIYEDTSPTLRAEREGLKVIVASRGRNPDNPSDRTTGSPTEQRLEVNQKGTSNTITTVQKDNYVLEPSDKPKLVGGIGEKNFGKQYRQGNRIYDSEAVAMCLNAQPVGNAGGYSYLYKTDYRIRKLTPKECWRLMGISDEDFEKAQEVNSNTQLYKQAGNAIVVDVLEGIFRKLFLSKSEEKGNKLEEQLEWLDELLAK